ncbi:hypothetical protein EN871_23965 [bacterium M00.F.Ca.ET.228.01.1.1]|uniref:hypothetical protein n=1 Tax=Paraburkholderia phenoliruptrix TaxID=252970 RepID=UPI0010920A1C|nr:hypothetical protein [Paraburkholderia phenoliruptrix]TGP41511.1 hypothetical protein EN871_23965 [bacterium M00.F.Ca.ET.228.01.1.1]TGR98169.1 hypothetical protein EN834_23580 [bacterium M00.F.Ca.ET.191.01.1.1]TGU02360.1 hypothetical protein EN798_24400 [bacterium M00.F.Ca.ET.155.01.1.1]MBW0447162.1 hypothetical protein [Paraburkholderia phenoliruptrix]MBW9101455.1 hypothetical protein [Paraburkholderia phenoliruptrix]
MSKVSAESGIQALAEFIESVPGEADVARIPVHARAKRALSFRQLKPATAQGGARPIDRPKLMRTPQTRERLHRLRHELGKIDPAPSTAQEAHAEVVKAMARANLGAWRVPELTAESAFCHPDGSVEVSLIAHVIVFNTSGAFRIVDTHPPGALYFEMCGRGGAAFVAP